MSKDEEALSPSVELIKLSEESSKLFLDDDGVVWGSFQRRDHIENWPLRSRDYQLWWGDKYYKKMGQPPAAYSVTEATGILDNEARTEGVPHPVFTRIGSVGEKVYLDLCDEQWRAVEIDADGWHIVKQEGVKFRRPGGMRALPEPVRGGSIDELRPFLNLKDEDDFTLLVGWLILSLNPRGPYPSMWLLGEQGSSKSVMSRICRALIDPNSAPLRTRPANERDLAISAQNSWMQVLDNVSTTPQWLSEALWRYYRSSGEHRERVQAPVL